MNEISVFTQRELPCHFHHERENIVQMCNFFLFFLLIFYCCAGWWYNVAFTKVLTLYQYITLEFNPSTVLPYPSLPLFLEQFKQVLFFHLHRCVHRISTIFTFPCPFLTVCPIPLIPIPPKQDMFCLPGLQFCK
jgi:hypothetical protein